MSLRTDPAVEHAALPDGGSVTVWVGVPEDSYVSHAELTTVDIQLHEGNAVVATMTTTLSPSQDDEARALARTVREAIERGDIGLHAEDLDRFL